MFGIFQESLGFMVISIEETHFTKKKKEFQAFSRVLVSLRHSEPRATPPPQDSFLSLLLAERGRNQSFKTSHSPFQKPLDRPQAQKLLSVFLQITDGP